MSCSQGLLDVLLMNRVSLGFGGRSGLLILTGGYMMPRGALGDGDLHLLVEVVFASSSRFSSPLLYNLEANP